MRSLAILLLLGLIAAPPVLAQDEIEVPFFLPTPQGWRTETIPLPLEFAPELEYEGLEELRFAPGMFDEGSEDFWSYAFVWWVPVGAHFETEQLETDLENYFRGLTRAVAESRDFDPGDPKIEVRLESLEGSFSEGRRWKGHASTYDAFATRRAVQLELLIDTAGCPYQDRLAVFFRLSPQPAQHQIWETLAGIRDGFRCAR